MQEILPQIIDTSYDDDEFIIDKLERIVKNFDVEGNYFYRNNPHRSMCTITADMYSDYLEYFVFKYSVYEFKVYIEKTKNIENIKSYMEDLAVSQGCNCIDKTIKCLPCVNNNVLGSLGFVHIAGAYLEDLGHTSNFTILIALEMP